jgi:hypothetical protein
MLYLVTFQLRPQRDPAKLEAELKNTNWWSHYLDHTWLVVTTEDTTRLTNRLYTAITGTDSLLVVKIPPGAEFHGWLPQEAWDWIRQHMWGY